MKPSPLQFSGTNPVSFSCKSPISQKQSRRLVRRNGGLGDAIRDLFDFESWAPRSSQAWRFGQEPKPSKAMSSSSDDEDNNGNRITEKDVVILNERLASQQQQKQNTNHDPSSLSFLRSTDEEFANALNARVSGMTSEPITENIAINSEYENQELSSPLSGSLLLELIYTKYGKKYDVAFVKRDIPGKTIVSFNIYHAYLGQRSFPMKEADYIDKLDGIAFYLEAWGQSDKIIDFLKQPIAPRRGLPSKPVIGNAVSVQLDLKREQIDEWFGGY